VTPNKQHYQLHWSANKNLFCSQIIFRVILTVLTLLNPNTTPKLPDQPPMLRDEIKFSLAYRSLVRPILEYGAVCWDPYREGQIWALDRVQNKAARFAHITKNSNWETLTSHRKLSRICALFKAYSGDRAWKPIGDRLKRPHYLSRVDHERKIRSKKQRTNIGKYSFLNRTIQLWNQLPAEVFENLPCKQNIFKRRVRKALIECN
jgi:hypothetical protein